MGLTTEDEFERTIVSHLSDSGISVCRVGRRYGSIFYIGLSSAQQASRSGSSECEVEIEFGAEKWTILQFGASITFAHDFSNSTIYKLSRLSIGTRFEGYEIRSNLSIIRFSRGIEILSNIEGDYSSGFLYAVSGSGIDSIESIDGYSVIH